MPTYDFRCVHCGHIHEKQLSIAQREDTVQCPKCDSPTVRLMSAPGIATSGWGTPKHYA